MRLTQNGHQWRRVSGSGGIERREGRCEMAKPLRLSGAFLAWYATEISLKFRYGGIMRHIAQKNEEAVMADWRF